MKVKICKNQSFWTWLFWFLCTKIEKLEWIRYWCNCLQLLGSWKFFVFFWFFRLKLVYFWTKSRKNLYECFFHSFCATDFKFGTKNNGRLKLSTLKTLIFENFDLHYQIEPNPGNMFMVVFIDLWLAYSPLNSAKLNCSSEVTLPDLCS